MKKVYSIHLAVLPHGIWAWTAHCPTSVMHGREDTFHIALHKASLAVLEDQEDSRRRTR